MQIEFDVSDVLRGADRFARAGELLMADIERRATGHSADAVRFIQRRFRTGAPYTTDTRTAIRAGRLIDAYDSRVDRVGRTGMDVGVGLIAPGADSQALQYGRVHEGYDAGGAQVSVFHIVPRAAEYLKFKLPPEKGGHFVMVKSVDLHPRPTLPTVKEKLEPVLRQDIRDAYGQVLQ